GGGAAARGAVPGAGGGGAPSAAGGARPPRHPLGGGGGAGASPDPRRPPRPPRVPPRQLHEPTLPTPAGPRWLQRDLGGYGFPVKSSSGDADPRSGSGSDPRRGRTCAPSGSAPQWSAARSWSP